MTKRTMVYRILKSDVMKRQIVNKLYDYVKLPEELWDDEMIYIVWDILGLKKERVSKVKTNASGEQIPDGYGYEYDWQDTLSEMYLGSDGVVEGGTDINEYIDTIIKMTMEEY